MSKVKITEQGKNQILALATAKLNNDPLYEKYKKVRNASLKIRNKLLQKYLGNK